MVSNTQALVDSTAPGTNRASGERVPAPPRAIGLVGYHLEMPRTSGMTSRMGTADHGGGGGGEGSEGGHVTSHMGTADHELKTQTLQEARANGAATFRPRTGRSLSATGSLTGMAASQAQIRIVLYLMTLYSKYTRALTLRNLLPLGPSPACGVVSSCGCVGVWVCGCECPCPWSVCCRSLVTLVVGLF